MIILLSAAILALILLFFPSIWNFCVPIIQEWCKEEPTRDSKLRILKDTEGNFHTQFSNDGGKTYLDIERGIFTNKDRAKKFLDGTISQLNKTEEVICEYDPHRLRITDGSEKEFQEEESL